MVFPSPLTFGGELASDFLIDKKEQEKRLAAMEKTCRACHSRSWTEGHFNKFTLTIAETDKMVATSTNHPCRCMEERTCQQERIPLTREIEHLWIKEWLFYGNSVRYGSADERT
ncbi:MAG: hypothetical protein MZV70_12340 [Desulfobacterales bacterium]|nr:hypothetical protein [Desulfobacterales bacterium]